MALAQPVADGVYLIPGSKTNFYAVTDGPDVLLIDTGYPGDRDRLVAALGDIGRSPADVSAFCPSNTLRTSSIVSPRRTRAVHSTSS